VIFSAIAPRVLTTNLESSKGRTIKSISDDCKEITLDDGVVYFLGETDEDEVKYWPFEMAHDWDLIVLELDDHETDTWRMWHGS
jgi:hypothetical protein